MIYIYDGKPGSGKSFHAARTIRDQLKYRKKPCICNFNVNIDESWQGDCYFLSNENMTPEILYDFADRYWEGKPPVEDEILLVIDECQLLWNSRLWDKDKNRMAWLQFLSQHRKVGYKIILIAQSPKMIDCQFRSLIEIEVQHRKASNYGPFGMFLKMIFLGEVFYACKVYYGLNEKIGGEFIRYSKKIASIYDSYTSFDGGFKSVTA